MASGSFSDSGLNQKQNQPEQANNSATDAFIAIVVNFDPEKYTTQSQLQSYFFSASNGGGEVLGCLTPWDGATDQALVWFDPEYCDPDVVDNLIEKKTDPTLQIGRYQETQYIGQLNVVLPQRPLERLFNYYQVSVIRKGLYEHAAITLDERPSTQGSGERYCLTGYLFQLSLANKFLRQLEEQIDKEANNKFDEQLPSPPKKIKVDQLVNLKSTSVQTTPIDIQTTSTGIQTTPTDLSTSNDSSGASASNQDTPPDNQVTIPDIQDSNSLDTDNSTSSIEPEAIVSPELKPAGSYPGTNVPGDQNGIVTNSDSDTEKDLDLSASIVSAKSTKTPAKPSQGSIDEEEFFETREYVDDTQEEGSGNKFFDQQNLSTEGVEGDTSAQPSDPSANQSNNQKAAVSNGPSSTNNDQDSDSTTSTATSDLLKTSADPGLETSDQGLSDPGEDSPAQPAPTQPDKSAVDGQQDNPNSVDSSSEEDAEDDMPGYVEDEFDKIFYEFMISVRNKEFRSVAETVDDCTITQRDATDSRSIVVKVEGKKKKYAQHVMAKINDLFSDTIRKVHSHCVKVDYKGGDYDGLEKALKSNHLGDFVARLVTRTDIRIISYAANIERDLYAVEEFVQDYKKKHPAKAVSKAGCVQIPLSNGTTFLRIEEEDLTKVSCDVIVSSSDPSLEPKRGVSKAIANASGQRFVADSLSYIKRNGILQVSETFVQRADGRPKVNGVKHVVHVVAPPNDSNHRRTLLQSCILNCLKECQTYRCHSVAFPLIGAGALDCPLKECIEDYWKAVCGFLSAHPRTSLTDILFVCNDKVTVEFMQQEMTILSTKTKSMASTRHDSSTNQQSARGATSSGTSSRAGSARNASSWHSSLPTGVHSTGTSGSRSKGRGKVNKDTKSGPSPLPLIPSGRKGMVNRPNTGGDMNGFSGSFSGAGAYGGFGGSFGGAGAYGGFSSSNVGAGAYGGSSSSNVGAGAYGGFGGSFGGAGAYGGSSGSNVGAGAYGGSSDFRSGSGADLGGGPSGSSTESKVGADSGGPKDDECPICMDQLDNPQTLPCSHKFCKDCLDQVKSTSKSHLCPICRVPFAVAEGKQPKGGRMTKQIMPNPLPGYPGVGTIVIDYDIPSGIQGPEHPSPGVRYSGTRRTAFLPNNTKGQLVLKLLSKAFDQRLIFTVGQSVTSGANNTVVWNDIHHKTSSQPGPYGYPDPDYLDRVLEDLKAKGITE